MPIYNILGEKRALYCNTHKTEEMIDIRNNRYQYDGCINRAIYNVLGKKKPIYCKTHKKEDMSDIINKCCIYEGCPKKPSYNILGESRALFCKTHKEINMVNVKQKRCKTLYCDTIPSNPKYKGYCLRCFIYTFPDEPVSRNYKTKEKTVSDFIIQEFPQYDFITDKKVSDGCSRRRPDILLDLGYQILIVEIDENQHRDYDCSCENKRLMEISQDLGHRPIIFIRFNPDDYKQNDKNITSCWGSDKNGILTIKKTKKKEWSDRLSSLKEQISYWSNPDNKTEKTIEIIHLFYDNKFEMVSNYDTNSETSSEKKTKDIL